jgi:hypothetical protein
MWDTALRHIPAGTVSQLHEAPSHFTRSLKACLDRCALVVAQGEGTPIPCLPRFSDPTP